MNETFHVEGLGGEHVLQGDIPVHGAKNDTLKIMAASLLFEDLVAVTNVPDVTDVAALAELLADMGVHATRTGRNLSLAAPTSANTTLDTTRAKRLRASVTLTGPTLARYGAVSFPHPGGCVIGARPIDLFIEAFKKMGADCTTDDHHYHFVARDGQLHGADMFLDIASVGVTETVMMAAVLATGTTIIRNAAMEPEIQNLAHYLAACGARITGIGTPLLVIEGGSLLTARGKAYAVLPDRIETGSFAILAALAGRGVRITHCDPQHVAALLSFFSKAGVSYHTDADSITVQAPTAPYRSVNIRTHEYPGFSTDLQAPMTVFLTQAEGEGMVFETLFEGRLRYTDDLVRMGADITMFDPHRVMVRGPRTLTGRNLAAPDLRAGLAYVIAATIAAKDSDIHTIEHIDRGYERVEERFRALGVPITRTQEK
ncbi:MAG: UDP-N-acetylglucosamine 1-carboxyvinyltransferase [Parcubacteria group bacterium 21-54-25]|nr:MAG: UDP-N-acetylglucosamine 1-carboxyvinyltransferase [Parcubacteria group bacterium 21-54-25]HQU07752.1 UDP-N-acetylglucosamine 1-carboxyvinyltransferase [Candidatus Paceibacterota bacterium]